MISKKVWINGKPLDEPYVRFLEPPNNMFRDNFPRVDTLSSRRARRPSGGWRCANWWKTAS